MFSCISVAKGIYEFKVTDDDIIRVKDRDRLDDVTDFLTLSNKRTECWKQQIALISKDMSITEALEYAIDLLRADCLMLLSECTASYCACNRFTGHVSREVIEIIVHDSIDKANNVISVGPGGMLQDFRILNERTADSPVNYYVLDNFKDFFEMATKFEDGINPFQYTGPVDANSLERALWFSYKCMLFGTFLTLLKGKVNLYLCESATDCANVLKSQASSIDTTVNNVVLGIDIMDDYAVVTLPAFTTVALQVPCTAFLVSSGYWDIFINEHYRDNEAAHSLSRDHLKVISTGQGQGFNIYAFRIAYKMNRVMRNMCRMLAAGTVLTVLTCIVAFW